ncbi:TonB C-terminal domain-containing protein [Cognatiluteimonas weifangensis]|uniref:Protein TolA n=1 Tax=Cognatiluteimonas weifangensis TaxID=2303539 RepID=A0A372DSA4_9GAMM|nr:TonB C-terminal domain-containing protein [Luteimonas weifangensis]RFP62461.1 protein TolA [Luteimonas weifangensis]
MRETRADTRAAVVSALALHALLFALLFAGLWWTRTNAPASAAGPAIEADLVDPAALSAPLRRALDAPAEAPPPQPAAAAPPQPQPEPRPQDAPLPPQPQAQERLAEPDVREQARVERDAEAAQRAAREQEEKRRQEQIDLTQRQRQAAAEQQRRLAQQRELQDKLDRIRAERARAQREADLAEQKLRQLADARSRNAAETAASASPPPGNEGADQALLGQYVLAIQRAVESNWTRPDNIPAGAACRVLIVQLPGGEVLSAEVDPSCPYDELGRRSVEAAVLRAQPLPYAGFERVFRRRLNFTFRPSN